MVGLIAAIFLVIPESPWWLASQGKIDKAAKVLNWFNGKVDGYSVDEQIVRHLLDIQRLWKDQSLILSRKS